jgi:ABC-type multidrug transport system ATPase subunit/ABC-type transport system involved in multi-copper enzyme maturation permease subunit
MITISHLSKRYGRRNALDDVSFTVRPGEVTLLLGANGAGKSTLLRCLLGITGYDGEIQVAGCDPLRHGPAVRSMIGYMPQSGGLHLDLTVAETARLYAGIRRAPIERADALLVEAGLGDHRETRVGELSGGMRQRLGFALALLPDPSILVLDEPSSSLDAASRQWLARRLREVAAEGRTVILSTHAGQELIEAGDQHIVLEDGRIISATHARTASSAVVSAGDRAAAGVAPTAGNVRPLIAKELRDALSNRWLLGYAILLGALGLAATATGLDSTSGLAMQAFGRTTATLMNLCLLLAPLVAVLMGAGAIAGEQERGTLDHLLAQPLTRTRLLLAKHVALLAALTGATLAGFTPAGFVVAAAAGAGMLGHYLLFPTIAALVGAAMASLGLLISVTSRSAAQAQGTAVFTWFALVLLYDLVLMGSLAVSGMPAEWLAAALVANPVDAARVLGVLALEPDLYLLGPAGAYLTATAGGGGAGAILLCSLLCWATLPTVGAMVTFMKPLRRMRSHGNERNGAAAGERCAGRDDRVRVGERVAGIHG